MTPGFRGRETAAFPTTHSRKGGLLGRHAQRAVQPDGLPVEHRILSDVTRERGKLARLTESRRMRDLLAERLARLLGEAGEQRRVESSGRDRVHADVLACQIARGGQS